MKLLAGVLALIVCAYLGYLASEKYRYKKIFYKDFLDFNKKLKLEIEFNQETIYKIASDIDSKNDFHITLREYVKSNKFNFNKTYINNNEKEFYKNYLRNIGGGDKNSQIKYLEGISNNLEASYSQAESDVKKYSPLYIKLGVLIGVAIMIILL